MQIIVLTEGDPIPIEIDPEGDTNTLVQLVAAQTGTPINEFYLDFEGQRLPGGIQVVQLGIFDGSVVSQVKTPAIRSTEFAAPIHQSAATASTSTARASIYDIPANVKPEELLKFCQDNPHVLAQLEHSDRDLANTLKTNDVTKLRAFMMKRMMQRHKEGYDRQQDMIKLAEDPENPELQRRIAEQVFNIQTHIISYSRFIIICAFLRFGRRTSMQIWKPQWRIFRKPLAVLPCCTSTSPSTMLQSRPLLIPAHKVR